jgi:S1-C subfamily serine protease
MTLRGMAAAAGVVLLLVGCTGDDDSADTATTTTAADDGSEIQVMDGTAVLEAVGPSMALVETPLGSGSAVLLADGHLVTNAHVVDPYGEADVTFTGEEPQPVEVVGVDVAADIAVLGPVETDLEGLAMESAADIPAGADLYLVGFPGDTNEVEVTIARGVLSRRRTAEAWGLDLLQTDAAISGGQSGGATVDSTGRVVGISGLSYDEQFALALAGEDVQASVDAILAGDGDEWPPLPPAEEATETEATVPVEAGFFGYDALYLPEGAVGGELVVTADEAAAVQVLDLTLYPLAVNEGAVELGAVEPSGDDDLDADLPEATAEDEPGTWTFSVPEGEPLLVSVGSTDPEATEVEVALSDAFAVVSPTDEVQDVEAGEDGVVDGIVTLLGEADTFFVELDEGESVTITAASPLGDVAFTTYRADDPDDPGEETDGGGGGVLDLDASSTLTAEVAGTYGIDVYQVDGYTNAYRLTIAEA